MSKYVGLQTQISKNNIRSIILLFCFPFIVVGLTWLFFFITIQLGEDSSGRVNASMEYAISYANYSSINALPLILTGVAIWFIISFLFNKKMIEYATDSHTLERRDNKRVYNLLENLTISQGVNMPKLNIIETEALNAFASGISDKSYTITLTRGIINKLNDDELEGVIAHELAHIQNKDVRLLIISTVFVGIFSIIASVMLRSALYGSFGRRKKEGGAVLIIIMILAFVGYLISAILKFAISRKREYLADAGAAAMTRKPQALANALRKISGNSSIPEVKSPEVAQMFIDNVPDKSTGFNGLISGLFAFASPYKEADSFS